MGRKAVLSGASSKHYTKDELEEMEWQQFFWQIL